MSESDEKLPGAAELGALLCGRLCHDLISPTSAIVSGLDLLDDPESQSMHEDARMLIRDSGRKLGDLLPFCRVAFGASASAETFDSRELGKLAAGYYAHQKADLEWAVAAETLEKPAARILMNLAQLGAMPLVRGGVVRITADAEDDSLVLRVHGSGDRVRLRPEIQRGLEGHALGEGLVGHWVQGYYVYLIADEVGGVVKAVADEEHVEISARLPVRT